MIPTCSSRPGLPKCLLADFCFPSRAGMGDTGTDYQSARISTIEWSLDRAKQTTVPYSTTVDVVLKRARHAWSYFPRKWTRIRRPHDEWQFQKWISYRPGIPMPPVITQIRSNSATKQRTAIINRSATDVLLRKKR